MGIGSHLIHRCTIQRASRHVDGYGADVATWADHATDVPCRLIMRAQRQADTVFAERPLVTAITMLFDPATDVRQGDRIRDVRQYDLAAAASATDQEAATVIDRGPFRIDSLLTYNRRGPAHRSAILERLGGRLDDTEVRRD